MATRTKTAVKKAEQKPANKTVYKGPFPRLGSIVQWGEDGSVGIVVWDDINHPEEGNVSIDNRCRWECYRLDDPSYREPMWFTTNELKAGEVRIVGHFDIFGLADVASEKKDCSWTYSNSLSL